MTWLKRMFSAPAQGPAQVMTTKPIVKGESETEHERIRQHKYRLDAIKRYLEQAGSITEKKRREFYVETVQRADFLYQAGAIDKEEHDAFIERVNDAAVSDRV